VKETLKRFKRSSHERLLLRETERGRATAAAGIEHVPRAELDLIVAEAEVRGVIEHVIAVMGKLIASHIHVQLLETDEPLGVSQDNGTACNAREAVFVGRERLVRPTHGLTLVDHAELGCDDEDLRLLLFLEFRHRFHRTSRNPQVSRIDLVRPVVVERALGSDLVQHELDSPAVLLAGVNDLGEVLGCQRINARDGEPSFGAVRQFGKRLGVLQRLGRVESEDCSKSRNLLFDRLGAVVLGGVTQVRADFFVLEPTVAAVLGNEAINQVGKTCGFVDALRFLLGEACLVVGCLDHRHELETLLVPTRDYGRSQCIC